MRQTAAGFEGPADIFLNSKVIQQASLLAFDQFRGQKHGERDNVYTFIFDDFAPLFPSLSGLHSSIIFSLTGEEWNAIEITDDVSGFPRSTASDKGPCDSLVRVIREKQQGRRTVSGT